MAGALIPAAGEVRAEAPVAGAAPASRGDGPRPDLDGTVSLRQLSRSTAASIHADLAALLPTLVPATPSERAAKALDMFVAARHRIARLLVATRWAIEFGDAGRRAQAVEREAERIGGRGEDAADRLWEARGRVRKMTVGRIPIGDREGSVYLEGGGGKRGRREQDQRVRKRRRVGGGGGGVVRAAVRVVRGVDEIVVGVAGVAECTGDVRVGVEDVWSAVIVMREEDNGGERIGVDSVAVGVKACVDTGGGGLGNCSDALTALAEARLQSAALVCGGDSVHRAILLLGVLRDLMEFEVCGPAALEILRTQAVALQTGVQGLGKVEVSGDEGKVVVKYWLEGEGNTLLTFSAAKKCRAARAAPSSGTGLAKEAVKGVPIEKSMAMEKEATPVNKSAGVNSSTQGGLTNSNALLRGASAIFPAPSPAASPVESTKSARSPSADGNLILVTHCPPLLGVGPSNSPHFDAAAKVRLDSINLEVVLLASLRTRAASKLSSIADALDRLPPALRVPRACVTIHGAEDLSSGSIGGDMGGVLSRGGQGDADIDGATQADFGGLALIAGKASQDVAPLYVAASVPVSMCVTILSDSSSGVQIIVSPRTGGLRVRVFGAASLAVSSTRFETLGLWKGDKHCLSTAAEEELVGGVVRSVRNRVRLDTASRSVCALDIGVSDTLPPGTASVAATASACPYSQLVPPCAPLERVAPKRFFTLSPAPPKDFVVSAAGASVSSRSGFLNTRAGYLSGLVTSNRSGLGGREGSNSKRPRLAYATTSDALVFIQESSAGEGRDLWTAALRDDAKSNGSGKGKTNSGEVRPSDGSVDMDRYDGTAAAAATWAATHDFVERRLRRDALLRAFVAANVASAAHSNRSKATGEIDLHLEASRTLLKLKCEPLPVRCAELHLRGHDAWQVRLSLLPPIFDRTNDILGKPGAADSSASSSARAGVKRLRSGIPVKKCRRGPSAGDTSGNLWSVGVACVGSTLTFTYPSANAASVRSFFRDLTRARTAAALARGVPASRFYSVVRRSPVCIVVAIGPFGRAGTLDNAVPGEVAPTITKPSYTATVEYVYSRGNSGGFSMTFFPASQTMSMLAPYIEEALDASGGQVGGILAGLLERACPVAVAAESAVREGGRGTVIFANALRVRVQFQSQKLAKAGKPGTGPSAGAGMKTVSHCVDMDAREGGGLVKVIDVGRATMVMCQQGPAPRHSSSSREEHSALENWHRTIDALAKTGGAQRQKAGSTVIVKVEVLEQFLSDLVKSTVPRVGIEPDAAAPGRDVSAIDLSLKPGQKSGGPSSVAGAAAPGIDAVGNARFSWKGMDAMQAKVDSGVGGSGALGAGHNSSQVPEDVMANAEAMLAGGIGAGDALTEQMLAAVTNGSGRGRVDMP